MPIPATLEEAIEEGLQEQISHRRLHGSMFLTYKKGGQTIKAPLEPLVNKYWDIIMKYVITVDLNVDEDLKLQCRFNPKAASYSFYDTTEYWSMLLYINECHSTLDFDMDILKIIEPEEIDDLINEILILENRVDI